MDDKVNWRIWKFSPWLVIPTAKWGSNNLTICHHIIHILFGLHNILTGKKDGPGKSNCLGMKGVTVTADNAHPASQNSVPGPFKNARSQYESTPSGLRNQNEKEWGFEEQDTTFPGIFDGQWGHKLLQFTAGHTLGRLSISSEYHILPGTKHQL